jgi:multisubunit Na+/H+ antiporter MnhG subunit
MGLDIRWPIGLMFSIVGALMAVFGFITNSKDIYQRSLNINVNLYWGLLLVVFGVGMLIMAWRGAEAAKQQANASQAKKPKA